MSGKQGQSSSKAIEIPLRYSKDFLRGLDRRSRAAKQQLDLFNCLLEECGGPEGLAWTELETIRRFAHLCRRMGQVEEADLIGQRIDPIALNDSTRSWIGLLRHFQAIKAIHLPGRQDLAKAMQHESLNESLKENQ